MRRRPAAPPPRPRFAHARPKRHRVYRANAVVRRPRLRQKSDGRRVRVGERQTVAARKKRPRRKVQTNGAVSRPKRPYEKRAL